MQALVEKELEGQACPIKAVMQISLAVEEIFVNVARYAYAPRTGDVTICCAVEMAPPQAVLRFSDNGSPFDPLSKPDTDVTLSAEKRQIGGVGLLMVKRTMDEVHYEYQDRKNILTLVKRF